PARTRTARARPAGVPRTTSRSSSARSRVPRARSSTCADPTARTDRSQSSGRIPLAGGARPFYRGRMGTLFYGSQGTPIDINDRALSHIKVVIVAKLRRGEAFTLSLQH